MWKYTSKNDCNDFLLSLHLFNCNDDKKYIKTLYALANNKENNYKLYKIKKSNGKFRTIYEPNDLLKEIQKNILNKLLEERSISKYATAYYKGRCLIDNSLPHTNKKTILKLDIENFFGNISFLDIYNSCFPLEYFPKSVGMLLAYLCTFNDYLPQGAPTSSYISNLVMKEFDEEIGSWCLKQNISYTRYSDDMTFSGDFNSKEVVSMVRKRLYKLGLDLNDKKTHVVSKSSCQSVTGLVVNKKVNIKKEYRHKIRQEVYYISKYGIDEHLKRNNIGDKETYLNSLYGRIMFVLQIDKKNKEFMQYKNIINDIKN